MKFRSVGLAFGVCALLVVLSLALMGMVPDWQSVRPVVFRALRITNTLDVDGAGTFDGNVSVGGTLSAVALSAPGFITNTENLAITGTLEVAGGQTNRGWVYVAPTPAATATPQVLILDAGTNNPLEIRNASATPVYQVRDGGAVVQGGALTVSSGGATITAGGLTVTAGGETITAGGLAVVAGQVDIGDWINLSAQTAISVTAGATITPTGTYQPLTSAAGVTTSTTTAIANGTETGDVLILRNANASDTITVDGTGGNVECKTDKVLGAGDTLTLVWNGSDWNCLSLSDNS